MKKSFIWVTFFSYIFIFEGIYIESRDSKQKPGKTPASLKAANVSADVTGNKTLRGMFSTQMGDAMEHYK